MFFFFKQKTAYEVRISDWSSDVCSSDLSEKSETVELEGVFVQIGLLPNSEWLKDSVKLSPRGEIEVDARGQTSVPGVFAAGDVTTVPYKQIVIAMGEGSKAAQIGRAAWRERGC